MATNMDFKTAKIYTEFDMCVETMNVWREETHYMSAEDTIEQIKYKFRDLTKEQMKMVFEEVESGYIWDIETDEIKHEDDEESDEDTMTCSCGYEGPCHEFEYLPSEEDEKEQALLGQDLCLKCYQKSIKTE